MCQRLDRIVERVPGPLRLKERKRKHGCQTGCGAGVAEPDTESYCLAAVSDNGSRRILRSLRIRSMHRFRIIVMQ